MAVSLKMPFVNTVCDDSLKNTYVNGKKIGYEFDIRLSNYRGHFLSCIEELSISINGEVVDSNDFTFSLNDKEFMFSQLETLTTEFWNILDPATIKIYKPGGLEAGEYNVELTLFLRIPYMPMPGNGENLNYVLLDSSGKNTLSL